MNSRALMVFFVSTSWDNKQSTKLLIFCSYIDLAMNNWSTNFVKGSWPFKIQMSRQWDWYFFVYNKKCMGVQNQDRYLKTLEPHKDRQYISFLDV